MKRQLDKLDLCKNMKSRALKLEELKLDANAATPVYLRLQTFIEEAIKSGILRAGDALPSERRMAFALSISRMTVRRAIDGLVEKSLVKRVLGSGTYILPSQVHQPMSRLQGFSEEARALGFVPGGTIIEIGYVAASARVASALSINTGSQVLRVIRLRTANGVPLAIQVAHISPNLKRFPVEDFLACGSLYEVISRHYGVWPYRAFQTVGARLPSKKERELLEVSASSPVLTLERITYDESGFPFEYVQSAYRGDRYQVWAELRVGGTPFQNPDGNQDAPMRPPASVV